MLDSICKPHSSVQALLPLAGSPHQSSPHRPCCPQLELTGNSGRDQGGLLGAPCTHLTDPRIQQAQRQKPTACEMYKNVVIIIVF